MGRQGRLAFMAWVSGLFSPSGFSPLEPPFPSNLSFAATHSNFCGTPLTPFIFQESSYSLPQPFSAGGSFHLFCHTQARVEFVIGSSGFPAKDCPERHKSRCPLKPICDGQAPCARAQILIYSACEFSLWGLKPVNSAMPRTIVKPVAASTLKRSKMPKYAFGKIPIPIGPANIIARAAVAQTAR